MNVFLKSRMQRPLEVHGHTFQVATSNSRDPMEGRPSLSWWEWPHRRVAEGDERVPVSHMTWIFEHPYICVFATYHRGVSFSTVSRTISSKEQNDAIRRLGGCK